MLAAVFFNPFPQTTLLFSSQSIVLSNLTRDLSACGITSFLKTKFDLLPTNPSSKGGGPKQLEAFLRETHLNIRF